MQVYYSHFPPCPTKNWTTLAPTRVLFEPPLYYSVYIICIFHLFIFHHLQYMHFPPPHNTSLESGKVPMCRCLFSTCSLVPSPMARLFATGFQHHLKYRPCCSYGATKEAWLIKGDPKIATPGLKSSRILVAFWESIGKKKISKCTASSLTQWFVVGGTNAIGMKETWTESSMTPFSHCYSLWKDGFSFLKKNNNNNNS